MPEGDTMSGATIGLDGLAPKARASWLPARRDQNPSLRQNLSRFA